MRHTDNHHRHVIIQQRKYDPKTGNLLEAINQHYVINPFLIV